MIYLQLIFYAVGIASFTLFTHFCMGNPKPATRMNEAHLVRNRILSWLGSMLLDLHEDAYHRYKDDDTYVIFWKLFLCPICLNFWFCTLSFIMYYFLGVTVVIDFASMIGLSYVAIKLLYASI